MHGIMALLQRIFFGVSCAVGTGILLDNHRPTRWRFSAPRIATPRLSMTRKFTDLLALLSLATALICMFGTYAQRWHGWAVWEWFSHSTQSPSPPPQPKAPSEKVSMVYDSILHNPNKLNKYPTAKSMETIGDTVALPWAIILSLLAAVTMAMDAHFTWHRYLLGQRIADRKVPTWQIVAVRTYIWFFFILPWVGMVMFLQLDERSDGLNRKPKWDTLYLVGTIHCLSMFPMHILWSGLMFLSFVRSVNFLRVQAEARGWVGPPLLQRVEILQSATMRSAAYVGASLVLYVYCFFIFSFNPWSAYISVLSMPYQTLMALSTHLCFNVRISYRPAEDPESDVREATGDGGVTEEQSVRRPAGHYTTRALTHEHETVSQQEFLQQVAQELGDTHRWPLFLKRTDLLAGGIIVIPRPERQQGEQKEEEQQQQQPPLSGPREASDTDGAPVASPPLPVPEPHGRPTSARRRKQIWRLWRLLSSETGHSGNTQKAGSSRGSLASLSQSSPSTLQHMSMEAGDTAVVLPARET